MSDFQTPNTDSANDDSLAGAMDETLSAWLRSSVDDMLPAEVVSYDDATNRAVIKPLVMIGTTDGRKVSRPTYPNVPVYRMGGGGFFMRFRLKPGDTGWIKATDRDMSLIHQRGWREDWPNTLRLHSFEDAMFFPDKVKNWPAMSDDFCISSDDGSTLVSMSPGRIALTASGNTLTIGADGVRHNGVNIGATHTHGGVESGGSNTNTPNP